MPSDLKPVSASVRLSTPSMAARVSEKRRAQSVRCNAWLHRCLVKDQPGGVKAGESEVAAYVAIKGMRPNNTPHPDARRDTVQARAPAGVRAGERERDASKERRES